MQIQTAVVKANARCFDVDHSCEYALFMRSIYELWALSIKNCAAVLNNHRAVDYTSHDDAHLPWISLSSSLDFEHLYLFGCLVIMHQGKAEVNDGKLDPRGVAGCFVGLTD